MNSINSITFYVGIILLLLTIVNFFTSSEISPSFTRSEAIGSISSILLILKALLSTEYKSNNGEAINLKGSNVLKIKDGLPDNIKVELGWGSQLLLTATPGIVILVYWKDAILIIRGLVGNGFYIPGSVTKSVIEKQKLLSLVNTKLYPGRKEFDGILDNLPSIMIYPLGDSGCVILGGAKERCFSISDEKWFVGWSKKVYSLLQSLQDL